MSNLTTIPCPELALISVTGLNVVGSVQAVTVRVPAVIGSLDIPSIPLFGSDCHTLNVESAELFGTTTT